MGEEPGPSYGPRNEDDDDEDEEEYEEASGGNRLLGFMFGNIDGAGDLDVDYLDEDAKEHLAALAEKLGSSLTDISLSMKSSQPHADASEQDYDEKAEDAGDYEDIDEQYEGPEIQATFEEDHLLPKAAYFPAEISLAALGQKSSVFDEENYDEDEDLDEEEKVVDDSAEAQTLDSTSNSTMLPAENVNQGCSSTPLDEITRQYQESSPEKAQIVNLGCNSTPLYVITEQNQQFSPEKDDNVQQILEEEKLFEDSLHSPVSSEDDKLAVGLEDFEDEQEGCQESFDEKSTPSLPVLYVEDGMVVLRFSEIFGVHEPVKNGEKKNYRYPILKEKHKAGTACIAVEEDAEAFLRGSYPGSFSTKKVPSVYDYSLAVKVHDEESQTFDAWQGIMTKPGEVFEQREDSCLSGEPMKESVTIDIAAGWRSPSCPKFPLLISKTGKMTLFGEVLLLQIMDPQRVALSLE